MSEKFLSRSGILKDEVIRKFIHIISGIVICLFYSISQRGFLVICLLFSLFIIIIIEFLRFQGTVSVPFLRDKEEKNIGGYVFFMLGVFISILVFDKPIAIASILILAIGDAASGIAEAVKRGALDSVEAYKKPIKSPDMILIMFTVSFLVGYFSLNSLTMGIFGAIGASVADGVHLRIYGFNVDDNLTIPLYSGLLMSLVS